MDFEMLILKSFSNHIFKEIQPSIQKFGKMENDEKENCLTVKHLSSEVKKTWEKRKEIIPSIQLLKQVRSDCILYEA